MTKKHESVYETPDMVLMEISSEGVLCASIDDQAEPYLGYDEFEKLF